MRYEDDKFIIIYHECDQSYIQKMIDIVKERMPKIMSFFQIAYNGKITIKLYDDIEEYKNNLINAFQQEAEKESKKRKEHIEPRKYSEWMIANTEDGNINMQSLELVRTIPDFKDYTEEEFLYNACHEFTHLCQQQTNSNSPGWFWEVLATTLGNPECQHETSEAFTIQDLDERFDEIDGYGAAYKIGKKLFQQYDISYIQSLIHDNDKMYETINQIISGVHQTKK